MHAPPDAANGSRKCTQRSAEVGHCQTGEVTSEQLSLPEIHLPLRKLLQQLTSYLVAYGSL